MNLRNKLTNSIIIIIISILVVLPVHPKNKGTIVFIKLLNGESHSGELFEVNRYEIIIYWNNKVEKLNIKDIKNIEIERRDKFIKGVLWGGLIGFAFGGSIALLTKAEKEGLLPTEEGQFIVSSLGSALTGLFCGPIISLLIPYRKYTISEYSETKKEKILRKLNRRARLFNSYYK